MAYVETADKTRLYFKDWGHGRPVVLIHGWPLNADSWESQAAPIAEAGFRVVAYDRRGFGRSEQPWSGYDYDTLADDLRAVLTALALEDATIAGFSMGGGEVARYMSRHNGGRVRQAALISSIAPYLLKTETNPEGADASVFEGIKDGIRTDRAAFFQDFLKAFYGQGIEGGGVSDAMLHWTWGMAMQASPKATLDCVDAFGRTDLRPDMAAFGVPTLIVHGDADQTVPIGPTGAAAAKAIPSAEFKIYPGAPHGLTATHGERLTADLLTFLRG